MVDLPSWKIMEFVNGKDDIPYMKWKIKFIWNHQPGIGYILQHIPISRWLSHEKKHNFWWLGGRDYESVPNHITSSVNSGCEMGRLPTITIVFTHHKTNVNILKISNLNIKYYKCIATILNIKLPMFISNAHCSNTKKMPERVSRMWARLHVLHITRFPTFLFGGC